MGHRMDIKITRANIPVPNTAIILAIGSKEHHQSKITYNRPRTMLPAVGKPLVVRVMDRLYRIGIRNYIVVLGETEGAVASYLNRRWMPDINLQFIVKLDTYPLGQILSDIAQEHDAPFLIAGYNSFTHGLFPKRLSKFHNITPDDLIISGAKNSLSHAQQQHFAQLEPPQPEILQYNTTESTVPAEVITAITPQPENDGQNLMLTDFAAAGTNFAFFLQNAPEYVRRSQQLIDIFKYYQNSGHTLRLARTSWVLQIETDSDLITLNRHLLDEQIDANILSEIPYTAQIQEPVRIDPGVSIGQGAVIGPHVYLESGSSVGRNTHIQNSIVLKDAAVPAQQLVTNSIVTTRGRLPQA